MARLKEKDKRPTRAFCVGDLVTLHPKNNPNNLGVGIIMKSTTEWFGPRPAPPDSIEYFVIFAEKEVDLWSKTRAWAMQTNCNPSESPGGIWCLGKNLNYEERSYPEWLDPPTLDDILLDRFGDIL